MATFSDKKIKSVLEKITNLLSKTTEQGCSEEEALQASLKAQQLLSKYNLSMDEITYKEQEFIKEVVNDKKRRNDTRFLVSYIAQYSDCKSWLSKRGGIISYVFFGERTATKIATFTLSVLTAAVEYEAKEYKKTEEYLSNRKTKANPFGVSGQSLMKSFKYGMINRLCRRLEEMTEQKKNEEIEKTNSGELVVYDKMKTVEEEFQKLGLELTKSHKQRTRYVDGDAYQSGVAVGNKVNINKGLNS